MKNIMVIDGAINCQYETYSIQDEIFYILFPDENRKFSFIEEVIKDIGEDKFNELAQEMYSVPMPHEKIIGLHGILFYENMERRKYYV